MCKSCVHETVCRYKTEFENLKNDIAKVTPTWASDRYVLFWNNLAQIYLDAGLLDECRIYCSMAYDILEGITGRSDKPSIYIPRTEDAK